MVKKTTLGMKVDDKLTSNHPNYSFIVSVESEKWKNDISCGPTTGAKTYR